MVSNGQIAYEAYCNKAGWKSLATGAPLPQWSALPDAIRDAWEAAAEAVTGTIAAAVDQAAAPLIKTTRCKFKFEEMIQTSLPYMSQRKFVFRAAYDDTIPEDRSFNRYTPTGHLEMVVDNPAVEALFKLGQQYYFDVSPVPAPNR